MLGCGVREKQYYAPPDVIPNTHRGMQSPGFWIKRHPFADRIILDSAGIALFNSKIENELKLTENITRIGPSYPGKELALSLAEEITSLSKQKLYNRDAKRIGKKFYRRIKEQMNFEAIPDRINVRYGFICYYADQRILPTEEILTQEPADIAFDQLQNSSLDIGVPLAILHESRDGVWAYAHTPASSGWTKKERIAFCSIDEFKSFGGAKPFVVVTSDKTGIFLDPALTQHFDYVRMGSRFSFNGNINSEAIKIFIPFQGKEGKFVNQPAYVKKEDVNEGYLPYTPRHIIQQAFKFLDTPYGWGGKDGKLDCSSFLQAIFATTGIILPRNSSAQGEVGERLGIFTEKSGNGLKLSILHKQAIGGVTVLQLKGHILLYLGMYAGSPYVIHETHGYREKVWRGDIVRALNRVVVSDLSLGKGSQKNSLLKRIISIRNIN